MKAQAIGFGLVFIVFITLVDLYSYRGLLKLSINLSQTWQVIINILFFSMTLAALFLIIRMMTSAGKFEYERLMTLMKRSMGYLVLIYVPKLFFISFLLLRDLIVLLSTIIGKVGSAPVTKSTDFVISRADFILRLGLVFAVIPFLSILYGIWKGKYNYKLQRVKLAFRNFPTVFNGLKIVQISDLHLGSFEGDPGKISAAVDLINKEKPDYILFTGDLVNNIAAEAKPFVNELGRLNAKEGKFSILGNHDYGTYYQWNSKDELKANMEELFAYHKAAGFTLLKNESRYMEREGRKISIMGVENWGEPPFPQYGDLEKTLSQAKDSEFKILMSHDPSHWDAKVRPDSDVDLTLSGHTHGMQFAISIPGWRWSPVKFKYPRWAGLYKEGNQVLYVNIGLGFIAFPGRVGTPPEITVIELFNENQDGNSPQNI